MTRTYSLAEVAEMVLPPKWKQPELWLMRRLLPRGNLRLQGWAFVADAAIGCGRADREVPEHPCRGGCGAGVGAGGLIGKGQKEIGVVSYLLPVFVSWLLWSVLLIGGWMLGGCGG